MAEKKSKDNLVLKWIPPKELDDSPYKTIKELVDNVEHDDLKAGLRFLGLKCGGTQEECAKRYFMIRGKPRDKWPLDLWPDPRTKKRMKKILDEHPEVKRMMFQPPPKKVPKPRKPRKIKEGEQWRPKRDRSIKLWGQGSKIAFSYDGQSGPQTGYNEFRTNVGQANLDNELDYGYTDPTARYSMMAGGNWGPGNGNFGGFGGGYFPPPQKQQKQQPQQKFRIDPDVLNRLKEKREKLDKIRTQQLSESIMTRLYTDVESRAAAKGGLPADVLLLELPKKRPGYCRLCNKPYDNRKEHDGSEAHRVLYIKKQLSMGFSKFNLVFPEVKIANMDTWGGMRLGVAGLDSHFGSSVPDSIEQNTAFKEAVIIIGELSNYFCKLCNMYCEEMVAWINHCTSTLHGKACLEKVDSPDSEKQLHLWSKSTVAISPDCIIKTVIRYEYGIDLDNYNEEEEEEKEEDDDDEDGEEPMEEESSTMEADVSKGKEDETLGLGKLDVSTKKKKVPTATLR